MKVEVRSSIRVAGRMERRRLGSILVASLAAFVGVGAVLSDSAAAGQERQAASLEFTKKRPGSTAGFQLEIDYVNPDDSEGKPPAVREVVEVLARGARIDTSVPAQCRASDLELMLAGATACPAASKVGTGFISLDTGLPGPARTLENDVVFLNNDSELIFVVTPRGAPASVVIHSAVKAPRTFVNMASFLPGTPPDGAAIDRVDVTVDAISRGRGSQRRSYVRTPLRCPRRGSWRNRIDFTYADRVSQRTTTTSPCRRRRS